MGESVQFNMIVSGIPLCKTPDTIFNVIFQNLLEIHILIDEAMKATKIKTKTKVIITALEELIRKSKTSGLKAI